VCFSTALFAAAVTIVHGSNTSSTLCIIARARVVYGGKPTAVVFKK